MRKCKSVLRTPLNGIVGVAGMLGDSILTEQQQESVRMIRKSGLPLQLAIRIAIFVTDNYPELALLCRLCRRGPAFDPQRLLRLLAPGVWRYCSRGERVQSEGHHL